MTMTTRANGPTRRFVDSLTMFVVCGLSLLLLVYVAYGEAQRHFLQFHLEKLQAQGRVVQSAVESYLRPGGLPLRQFVGFGNLAGPIVEGDPWVVSLTAFDEHAQPVFNAGEQLALLPRQPGDDLYGMRKGAEYFQAVLPLRNKFETVGSLVVSMPRGVVLERVEAAFEPLLALAGVLTVAFTLFMALAGPRLAQRRLPWLQIAYAVTFLAMTGFVIATLVSLYSEGAQAKVKALADTLVQRVDDIVEYNLDFDEIGGLDRTFAEYRRLNPDISAAGLAIDGIVAIHTDPAAIGRPWVTDPRSYEYSFDIVAPNNPRVVTVAVALPVDVVYRQVLRSVKNFTALFVASGFLAGIFLQLASSMQRAAMRGIVRGDDARAPTDEDLALGLVKPVFFVAVFIEHLTYAFLPQFMHRAATESGYSAAAASVPFMAYYLFFALSLIPAGHVAQRHGTRILMWGGLLLSGAGLAVLALPLHFHWVVLARALSGIGQGVLFISVQSYILTMALPGKKTQGAAIIVWGFQGGMISGMAIGSLLVAYIEPAGVFALAGVIALLMAAYAGGLVPSAPRQDETARSIGASISRLGYDMRQVLRDGEFLRTMLLIGIPAKAVMTGVVIFALPLLLAGLGFAQEDIGQILMVYAFGVLVASTLVSRMVDRSGNTDGTLFRGAALSGVGLILAGAIGWGAAPGEGASSYGTVLLIAGVLVVGVAHGFINAPVVTHIADSDLAARIGAGASTATYRFLERIGHVAGPIIVGQLFLLAGQRTVVVAWIGCVVLLFGFLFLMRPSSNAAPTQRPLL
jgi:predicted MFS family arabinose efflux permease